jgi:ketosteroid isomerase-like protein
MSNTTEQTAATLAHHLQAIGEGVDAIMTDYVEDSVIFTPNGPVRGLEAISSFFTEMLGGLPPGFMEAFEMVQQVAEGEIAYIVWTAGDLAPLGTDTFVIRDGKIVVQTFAAHVPAAA